MAALKMTPLPFFMYHICCNAKNPIQKLVFIESLLCTIHNGNITSFYSHDKALNWVVLLYIYIKDEKIERQRSNLPASPN